MFQLHAHYTCSLVSMLCNTSTDTAFPHDTLDLYYTYWYINMCKEILLYLCEEVFMSLF